MSQIPGYPNPKRVRDKIEKNRIGTFASIPTVVELEGIDLCVPPHERADRALARLLEGCRPSTRASGKDTQDI